MKIQVEPIILYGQRVSIDSLQKWILNKYGEYNLIMTPNQQKYIDENRTSKFDHDCLLEMVETFLNHKKKYDTRYEDIEFKYCFSTIVEFSYGMKGDTFFLCMSLEDENEELEDEAISPAHFDFEKIPLWTQIGEEITGNKLNPWICACYTVHSD